MSGFAPDPATLKHAGFDDPFISLPLEYEEKTGEIWQANGDGIICQDLHGTPYIDELLAPIIVEAVNAAYKNHHAQDGAHN